MALNRAELMERLGGDTELLAEVIELFLEDCPKRLAAIKAAVDERDAELIRTTAHALKGAAGTISAAAPLRSGADARAARPEKRLEAAEAAWRLLAPQRPRI